MNEKYSSIGGAKIIVAVGGLLVLGLLASGMVWWKVSRQQAEEREIEARREAQEQAQREAAYMTRWQAEEAARAAKEEAAKAEAMAEAMAEAARLETQRKRAVVVSAADISRYSATDFGGGITREHFVAMMGDDKATELARQTFSKNATGQVVRWLLHLSDVQAADKSGPLVADFEMPYSIAVQIEGQNGIANSRFRVRAEFPATERERLLTLRRGDWATVEGRLHVEPSVLLLDAKIALPTDAETPER